MRRPLSTVRGSVWLARLLCGLLLTDCAEAPREARVRVRVRDEQGKPIARAALAFDGVQVALTGDDGSAAADVQGGLRVRVSVHCPPDYRSPEPRSVPLARGRNTLHELVLVCRPALRSLLVVVRVPKGERGVLRADGEPLGELAPDGTLHAIVRRAPQAELELSLEVRGATTARRKLRVLDRDEVIRFDYSGDRR